MVDEEKEIPGPEAFDHWTPTKNRVLVRMIQPQEELLQGGILQVDRTVKYMKEAVEAEVIKIGPNVNYLRPGAKCWLDRKTWTAAARFCLVREPDILAFQE